MDSMAGGTTDRPAGRTADSLANGMKRRRSRSRAGERNPEIRHRINPHHHVYKARKEHAHCRGFRILTFGNKGNNLLDRQKCKKIQEAQEIQAHKKYNENE